MSPAPSTSSAQAVKAVPFAHPPNPITLLLDETGQLAQHGKQSGNRQLGGWAAVNAAAVAQHNASRNHR